MGLLPVMGTFAQSDPRSAGSAGAFDTGLLRLARWTAGVDQRRPTPPIPALGQIGQSAGRPAKEIVADRNIAFICLDFVSGTATMTRQRRDLGRFLLQRGRISQR